MDINFKIISFLCWLTWLFRQAIGEGCQDAQVVICPSKDVFYKHVKNSAVRDKIENVTVMEKVTLSLDQLPEMATITNATLLLLPAEKDQPQGYVQLLLVLLIITIIFCCFRVKKILCQPAPELNEKERPYYDVYVVMCERSKAAVRHLVHHLQRRGYRVAWKHNDNAFRLGNTVFENVERAVRNAARVLVIADKELELCRIAHYEIKRALEEEVERDDFKIVALEYHDRPITLPANLSKILTQRTNVRFTDRDYLQKICNFLPRPLPHPLQDQTNQPQLVHRMSHDTGRRHGQLASTESRDMVSITVIPFYNDQFMRLRETEGLQSLCRSNSFAFGLSDDCGIFSNESNKMNVACSVYTTCNAGSVYTTYTAGSDSICRPNPFIVDMRRECGDKLKRTNDWNVIHSVYTKQNAARDNSQNIVFNRGHCSNISCRW